MNSQVKERSPPDIKFILYRQSLETELVDLVTGNHVDFKQGHIGRLWQQVAAADGQLMGTAVAGGEWR